ncbi:MAG: filamentous hemagglutinin N-terminal domain-containing protein [Chroococcus sp. CMT-3BRIN-NPC107]|jgi:filamentous hemagglutinin family protein|nr:filamentous hemagglutinin N-terminal domain-containing protein [Chroococcus sp. CMT-3BRIN-NPC107]
MKKIWVGLFSVVAISSAIATNNCAIAQISPDTTLGSESSLTQADTQFPIDIIEGGATRGANLFHSFSEFNIEEGRGAYFYSPSADIQNILARVTGSNPSTILGTIGTYGNSIPNLFLINPNGIIFGANASLDMGNSGLDVGGTGGSFVATTANAVILGDTGGIFSASNPAASNLLNIAPSALFFNSNSPAEIVNRSSATTSVLEFFTSGLQVPNSRSLLLVGGKVTLDDGELVAAGGRVELAGVTQGTLGLNIDGNDLSLNYPDEVQRADIVLTNNSAISVLGNSGGNIVVYAQNLDVLEQSQLYGGILAGQGAVDAQAGDITLNATGTIAIAGKDNSFSSVSAIFNTIGWGAVGQGGDINIIADSLFLNGAGLSSISSGQGNVGSIFIQVENSASFVNSGIFSNLSAEGTGNAGNIAIQAESIFFSGTNLSTGTSGQGNAGNIFIQAGLLSLNDSLLSATTSGQGDAGSIFIQVPNSVSINSSTIISDVDSGAIGKGGNIDIQARSLALINNSGLSTGTRGQGDAGSVFIQSNAVVLDNSRIFSSNFGNFVSILTGNEEEIALGNGGDIRIVTGSLTLNNDAALTTSTLGLGDAGNVFISATGSVSLARSSISSDVFSGTLLGVEGANGEIIDIIGATAVGNGGDINIDAQSLSLSDESLLATGTFGLGDAGNVAIQTSGAVRFTNNSGILSGVISNAFVGLVGAEAVGKGGDLSIVADSLTLDSSTLATNTAGEGNSGAIFIQANDIFITNDSRITSAVQQGGIGDAGDINIQAGSLYITGGSQIRAAVERERDNLPGGQGKGGNISINASETVDISGVNGNGFSSALSTSSDRGASGEAGNIIVNTSNFRIADGAVVNALTANSSNAGNITINANNFTATGGGQVLTTTSSGGNAGSINLNVANNVDLSGSDPNFASRQAQFGTDIVTNQSPSSGLFANTALGSTGSGGSIFVNSQEFNISENAGVSVDSRGQGNAGNLQVTASSISLDRGAFISASTASGEGGGVDIQAEELLLLRRNSNITTAAGGTGNGGNIELDATFIVAPATEDSNIIADAIAGNGGNINLTAQGIFGIASRPQQTPLSDITASSELGIDGTIAITNPDVDPSQGLIALPVEVIDATNQIAAGCSNDRQATPNKFIVTGRGGLPPDPGNTLANDAVLTDWATLEGTETNNQGGISITKQPPAAIVEAQGWMMDTHGRVVLTAQVPQVTPNSSKPIATSCNEL